MQKTYTIIGAIIILILIVLGVRHYSSSTPADTTTQTADTSTNTTSTSVSTNPVSTADWKVYKSAGDLVEFAYPSTWTLSGTTLKSPTGAITVNASYKSGSLPKCDPSDCAPITINGLTYLRTQDNTPNGTNISYNLAQKGFLFNATAAIVNNPDLAANVALVNQIAGTVVIKSVSK
jgi:hypothetical protein